MEIWLRRPELSRAELSFDAAQSLYERIQSVEKMESLDSDKEKELIDAWWKEHHDLHQLQTAMPTSTVAVRQRRM